MFSAPLISDLFPLGMWFAVLGAYGVSLLACVVLVLTQRWHGKFSTDVAQGIQKFHTMPTPRIGGIPIVLGLWWAIQFVPADVEALTKPILLAGMPAFFFGLAEDLTKQVGVFERLLATMASGLLVCWMTGYAIQRVDLWGLDWVLQFTLASWFFSAFAVGGLANAINIIDGFNGLASSAATWAFAGYAAMAWQAGDINLMHSSFLLGACALGFLCVNWPLGKIFLGDGGAYFLGFALAWTAILLVARNSTVAAFSVLLVCAHPVLEVLLSIYRRKIKKLHPGHPDRLHFHSLLKQRYVRRWFPRLQPRLHNSITGVVMGSITALAAALAFAVQSSPALSALAFLAFALFYLAFYVRMVQFKWFSPVKFLFVNPN